jgi:hypothetical protein
MAFLTRLWGSIESFQAALLPSDQVGSSGTGAPSGLIRLISTICLIQSTAMIGTISNQIDSQLSDISSLCTH